MNFWKRVLSLRNLLLLVLLITVLYVLINPDVIYESGSAFEVNSSPLFVIDQFHVLPEESGLEFIYASNSPRGSTRFIFRNSKTNLLKELEVGNLSIRSNFTRDVPNFYYNESDGTIYLIGTHNRADYHLIELKNDTAVKSSRKFLFRNHYFDELCEESITIDDRIITSCKFAVTIPDTVHIKQSGSGYEILLSRSHLNAFLQNDLSLEESYTVFADIIKRKSNINISPFKLDEVINFFRRNAFYKKRMEEDNDNQGSFYPALILGFLDANADGNDDIIIAACADRWLPVQLFCYDLENDQLLWRKEFDIGTPELHEIIDIDDDHRKEIIFSTYAVAYEDPIDKNRKERLGNNKSTFLIILDDQGEVKKINGNDAVIEIPVVFSYINFLYIPQKKHLLFGIKSYYDNSIKKMQLVDMTDFSVQELDIEYSQLSDISMVDNDIVLINENENSIQKIVLADDYSIKKTRNGKIGTTGTYFKYNVANFAGETLSMGANPSQVFDGNFNSLFTFVTPRHEFQWQGNTLYYIKELEGWNYLHKSEFSRNPKINPYLIVVFLTEILALTIYLLIYQIFTIPLILPSKTYFTSLSILGFIFRWDIKGKVREHLKLNRKFSFDKNDMKKILFELAEEPQIIYRKNFLLFQYSVFEIPSRDESEIIQRISHDMKNQVLMMKMLTDQHAEEIKDNNTAYLHRMTSSIENVSEAAQMLSRFSHIDKLYKERVELNMFIRQVLMNHVEHSHFHCIEFDSAREEIEIAIDENLFRIALDNLIMNALEEVRENQNIDIVIHKEKGVAIITITNPINREEFKLEEFGNIGYSSKPKGSGIGLPIAKIIIERHEGELNYNLKDSKFVVEIKLLNKR